MMDAALEQDVLQSLRVRATEKFAQLGWPTTRVEEWRYTNLAPLAKMQWQTATEVAHDAETRGMSYCGRALAELVFVNGVYAPESCSGGDAAGVRVTTVRHADPDTIERHFGRHVDLERNAMAILNAARGGDGAIIEVDAAVEGFVHILFVGSDGFEAHPHNLVVVGRGAQVSVVESYVGSGTYFMNSVTEIVAADGAVVDHYRLVCESRDAFHIGNVHIHQERASNVTSRSIAVGGGLVRAETAVVLNGEGASITLDGLFVANGKQHIDNHTVIDHVKPHCESQELYKGILDDTARGVFDGRIIVRPDAKKTQSRQVNRNLLLSETAIIDSKPTLEIHNDDVKCNHGSTIGQIEAEPLFYLRSRGIGEEEARNLLVYAFARELVDRMKIENVREQIGRALFQAMPERLPERRGEGRGTRGER
jgi:Fe-S cluster assembly protein SufD